MRIIKLLAVSVLALAGCKAPSEPAASASTEVVPSSAQCMKDTDCKGDRICEKGMCMAPTASSAPSTIVDEPAASAPVEDPALEQGFLAAMTLVNPQSTERKAESGPAIQAYMKAGNLKSKPDHRSDYSDYYKLIKPAKLLGHEMIEVEEEYMSEWVGCCPSEGLGVTLKVNGDTTALLAFVKANKCRLFIPEKELDFQTPTVQEMKVGTLVTMSCRERDVGMVDEKE